ncbi:LCP family protein [Clostridium swellfunianum]|uniref:LCP family protein n=1 Tax=Clostridium swellfunianum TaxID=1367462 RepID=UPI0020306D4A|nr:LCP family protein [Clostridium swellfunianum]MCM0650593.1 LCP family protein [Clostridium swellfunianum]
MEKKTRSGSKQKPNKKKRKKYIIISIVFVLLAVISAVVGGFYAELSKINTTKLTKDNSELGISDEAQKKIEQEDPNNEITNIALFGVDRRSKNEASRSDSLMIATIDKKHKKIKITSIMRDSYVNVPGHGKTKITHAYAYGGPQLAIRTLNENFQLNIKDYATVDFFSLEKIINSLGGVQINVTKEELPLINGYVQETASIEKVTPPVLSKSGVQNLNGMQAVAYTRIRYTAGGDFERTERQRTVLNALFSKVQQAGVSKYPSIVSTILPYVETSIDKLDIISMGTGVLTSGTKTLEQERFPLDNQGKGQTISGVWYLVFDVKTTADQIHKYIYDDIKP